MIMFDLTTLLLHLSCLINIDYFTLHTNNRVKIPPTPSVLLIAHP